MFRSQTKCKHWLAEKSREPSDWLFYYYDSQSDLIINTHPPMLSSDLMTGTTGVKCELTLKMNPPTHSMCFCLVMTHCNVMTRPETTHSTESLCFCVSCYDSCSFIWWYGPYYDHTMVGSDFLMRPKLWMNWYAGTHWDYSTETTHTTVNCLLSVHKSTLSPLSSLLSSVHTIIVVIITTNVIIHMVVSPQGWLLFAIEELFGRLTTDWRKSSSLSSSTEQMPPQNFL